MSIQSNFREVLARRLKTGWLPQSDVEITELLDALVEATSGAILRRLSGYSSGVAAVVMNFCSLRLHSMDEVPCFCQVHDEVNNDDILEFFHKLTVGRLAVIFALTPRATANIRKIAPLRQIMVLGPEDVRDLLLAQDGRNQFRKLLLKNFSPLRLVPFNVLRPVDGHMFFGRDFDLKRLMDEPTVSFALSGPEGLGKTSLLHQYERELIRSRDSRVNTRVYINFMSCPTSNEDVVRHLAMGIDPTRKSWAMSDPSNIKKSLEIDKLAGDKKAVIQFIKRHKAMRHDQPLDLLLDDVDEVCRSSTFQALADCAKDGLCRLVLAGRSGLLELLLDKKSPFKGRLELMRLEPLDASAAEQLVLGPLIDLDWTVENPDRFCSELFRLTGRLPHLLQFCAKKICDLAVKRNAQTIKLSFLEEVRWDFDTMNTVTSALRGIKNQSLKAVAYELVRQRPQIVTASLVERVARELDVAKDLKVPFDKEAAEDECKRLVLESVLSFFDGNYRLSSEVLPEYAERQGLIEPLRHGIKVV